MNRFWKTPLAAAAALVLCTVILYANKLPNKFAYDDFAFIVNATEQSDIRNIPVFFTTHQHRLYRPIRSVAYTTVRYFFGTSEIAHQAVGVFFHTVIALLFFAIILQLSGNTRLAFFASLIQAWHPVHVARVAFVTGSFDLLGLLFAFAALAVWLSYLKTGNRSRLFGFIALYMVALLGSEEAATVPLFIVLFYLGMPQMEKSSRRLGIGLVLSFSLLVIYLFLRGHFVPGFSRVATYQAGGLYETILTMAVVFIRYIGLCFFPVGLAAEHAVTLHKTFDPQVVGAFFALFVLTGAALYYRKKSPLFFVAVGWFFIGLAPFSNLIPLQSLMTEHYLYSGLMGAALVTALFIEGVLDRVKTPRSTVAVYAIIAGFLALFFALALERIHVWHDSESLWSDSVAKDPDTYMANLNLSVVLVDKGDLDGARTLLEKAQSLKPEGPEAYVGLGNIEMAHGKFQVAEKRYNGALTASPGHLSGMEGLVQALLAQEKFPEAFKLAQSILKLDSNSVVSLNVVGYILAHTGRCDMAVPYLKRLIKIGQGRPVVNTAKDNLAKCEKLLGVEKQ